MTNANSLGLIEVYVSNETAERLDRAWQQLDCSMNAEYSEVIDAALDAANIEVDE